MTTISVIIPVYNRAEMVKEAILSVCNQTRPADEIIVVDDGSDDNSADAAMSFKETVLLQQSNMGISAARNAGVKKASGDLIAFLDSDDLWKADKLRLQEEYMAHNPGIELCHSDEIWILNQKRINQKLYHKKEGGNIFLKCLKRCLISPSAVMIQKSLFSKVGLFDEQMTVCEDYDLWLRITAHHNVGFIDSPLIIKRGGHEDQLSKQYPVMDIYRLKALEKILSDIDLAHAYREAAMQTFKEKWEIVVNGFRKRGKSSELTDMEHWLKNVVKSNDKLTDIS